MKHLLRTFRLLGILTLSFGVSTAVLAQKSIQREIQPFKKVVVCQGVDLVLEQGAEASLQLAYSHIDEKDIIAEVKGQKLMIYLKGCQYGCKGNAHRDARVKAYLTYQHLNKLIIRGDSEVVNYSNINTKKFTLRSFGDGYITLRSVQADRMKAAFYGDSELTIEKGKVQQLRIKIFGDNVMNLSQLPSEVSKICVFGDSELSVQVHGKMDLTVLGDSHIQYQGDPWIDKKLVLGDMSLQQQ
jgi:hypothetical protein